MDLKIVLLFLVVFVVKSQCATIEQEVYNSTKFTLDWYRKSSTGENVVISPLSFRILLSLLYQGSAGDTANELRDNLYLTEKRETAISQRLTLDKIIESPNLKVVNRIYVNEGVELSQTYLAKALAYHSGIEQIDFSKSEQTANEISQFVEEQTNHLIKDLVSPSDLSADTMLLLLNTLYFKADWAIQFKEGDVYKQPFSAIDGHRYSIDFMSKEDQYNGYYSSDLKAMTLKLDYVAGSNCKFVMILPDENTTIDHVKNKLNPETLHDILQHNDKHVMDIFMPKFEIETEIDGNVVLPKLGLVSMFEKEQIYVLENGSVLSVSKAKQKAKIIVNTKGTEAAAASYATPVLSSYRYVERLSFTRPFIYLIVTEDTSEPLFIGHFSQPAAEFLMY